MKLNDKIYEAIHLEIYKNESDNCDGFQDSANKVEKIADEFAIGFASWCEWRDDRAFKTYEELLEIYKKEKGL